MSPSAGRTICLVALGGFFLAPMVSMLTPSEAAVPTTELLVEMVALSLIFAQRRGSSRVALRPWVRSALLSTLVFVVLALLSGLLSPLAPNLNWYLGLGGAIAFAIVMQIVLQLVSGEDLADAATTMVIVLAIAAFANYYRLVHPQFTALWKVWLYRGSFDGIYHNENIFAGVTLTLLAVILAGVDLQLQPRRRFLGAMVASVLTFLTYSRIALLALGCLWVLTLGRHVWRLVWKWLVPALVLLSVFAGTGGRRIILGRLPGTLSVHDASLLSRFQIWGESWHMFLARPFVGWGPGDYVPALQWWAPQVQTPWVSAHDVWLTTLVTGGIPTLLALLAVWAVALHRALAVAKISPGPLAGLVAYTLVQLTDGELVHTVRYLDNTGAGILLFVLVWAFGMNVKGRGDTDASTSR